MEQILFDPMLGYSSFTNTAQKNKFNLTETFKQKFDWTRFLLNIVTPFLIILFILFVFMKLYKKQNEKKMKKISSNNIYANDNDSSIIT